jgi:TPP-dependent pyruvate/acetoin dehydrogenase alpha subunit
MKRYPAFDPPEYVGWKPDAEVMEEYARRVAADPERRAILEQLPAEKLLRMYEGLLRFRLHDIALKRWVRQGVLSKAWLGTGEEAVTIGNVHALSPGDLVGPMIRNAGACHEMGMPVAQMLKAYLATGDQITKGRDLHTGDPQVGVIPPISFVASLVPVFTGIALAFRRRGEERVALTWVGDGASHTAEFHEGFNLAAVQRLPVLIVLQNNQVALGTPLEAHQRARLEDLAAAYGVRGLSCDGNNVLDTYAATALAAAACRKGEGPVILTAHTFRMGGHATHDEQEARSLFPAETFRHWGSRDPIGCYEAFLERHGTNWGLDAKIPGTLGEIEARVLQEVDAAAEEALRSRIEHPSRPEDAVGGVTGEDEPGIPRFDILPVPHP